MTPFGIILGRVSLPLSRETTHQTRQRRQNYTWCGFNTRGWHRLTEWLSHDHPHLAAWLPGFRYAYFDVVPKSRDNAKQSLNGEPVKFAVHYQRQLRRRLARDVAGFRLGQASVVQDSADSRAMASLETTEGTVLRDFACCGMSV